MSRGNWEVIPNLGDHYLRSIGQDVSEWEAHKAELEPLVAKAQVFELGANNFARDTIRHAFDEDNEIGIEKRLLEIIGDSPDYMDLAAKAMVYQMAAHKLKQKGHGTNYLSSYDRHRAQLTVLSDGVMVEEQKAGRLYLTAQPDRRVEAPVDQVFTGKVVLLDSSPDKGGLLRLAVNRRRTLEITGLVKVEPIEPAVDILIKRRCR